MGRSRKGGSGLRSWCLQGNRSDCLPLPHVPHHYYPFPGFSLPFIACSQGSFLGEELLVFHESPRLLLHRAFLSADSQKKREVKKRPGVNSLCESLCLSSPNLPDAVCTADPGARSRGIISSTKTFLGKSRSTARCSGTQVERRRRRRGRGSADAPPPPGRGGWSLWQQCSATFHKGNFPETGILTGRRRAALVQGGRLCGEDPLCATPQ